MNRVRAILRMAYSRDAGFLMTSLGENGKHPCVLILLLLKVSIFQQPGVWPWLWCTVWMWAGWTKPVVIREDLEQKVASRLCDGRGPS